MITDRRRSANRANAKSSTGPKTAPGKARSAQNALRHGLNVPILSDPAFALQVEAIALKIAGPRADVEALECGRRIAEAQIDLNRVRDCRRRLITNWMADAGQHSPSPLLSEGKGDEELAAAVVESASQLAALDRYERRALSRRKSAVREFDEGHKPRQV